MLESDLTKSNRNVILIKNIKGNLCQKNESI